VDFLQTFSVQVWNFPSPRWIAFHNWWAPSAPSSLVLRRRGLAFSTNSIGENTSAARMQGLLTATRMQGLEPDCQKLYIHMPLEHSISSDSHWSCPHPNTFFQVLKDGGATVHDQGQYGESFCPTTDYMIFKAQTVEPEFSVCMSLLLNPCIFLHFKYPSQMLAFSCPSLRYLGLHLWQVLPAFKLTLTRDTQWPMPTVPEGPHGHSMVSEKGVRMSGQRT
jgi:hypothetical protein